MAPSLQSIEKSIRNLFESLSSKLIGNREHIDLHRQVIECMLESARTDPSGQTLAPDKYYIRLSQRFFNQISKDTYWTNELIKGIQSISIERGLILQHIPRIELIGDDSLLPNEVKIKPSWGSEETGNTGEVFIQTEERKIDHGECSVFLVLEGNQIFPLEGNVINLGRQADNHLVIDDPRVSRKHAQIRHIHGRYEIFDLGSTGGTSVNGQSVTHYVLKPGDVISLAGYIIIYGEEGSNSFTDKMEIT